MAVSLYPIRYSVVSFGVILSRSLPGEKVAGSKKPSITHNASPFNRQLSKDSPTIATHVLLESLKTILLTFFLFNKECNLEDISRVQRRRRCIRPARLLKIPVQ